MVLLGGGVPFFCKSQFVAVLMLKSGELYSYCSRLGNVELKLFSNSFLKMSLLNDHPENLLLILLGKYSMDFAQ